MKDEKLALAEPELTACIQRAGGHGYLGHWPSEGAVMRFEVSADYQRTSERLMPLLRMLQSASWGRACRGRTKRLDTRRTAATIFRHAYSPGNKK